MTDPTIEEGMSDPGVGFREFVVLIAALNMINALGIDIILPSLDRISDALAIVRENDRQFIISAYVLGMGMGQMLYGPLADRYGRRPPLLLGIAAFTVLSLAAAFANGFYAIVGARLLQGVGAAACRTVTLSIVRDCYAGRHMARITSLTSVVFLAVPVLAPSIGQLLLAIGPWQLVLFFLAGFGLIDFAWVWLRLRETLRPENRRPATPAAVLEGARMVIGNRTSIGYTIAGSFMFGSLMGYINSVQQVFDDVFHRLDRMPLFFALAAIGLIVASLVNAKIVERLGMHRISHAALFLFIALGIVHVALILSGTETLLSFGLMMGLHLFAFGLFQPNSFAMAMEPLGHVAGTASSLQGFISTIGATLCGIAIGQMFDGSTLPLAIGFTVLGMCALVTVVITERGQLFKPHQQAAA